MLQCWDVNPTKRPSFSELVKIFDGLLSIAHVSTILHFIVLYVANI